MVLFIYKSVISFHFNLDNEIIIFRNVGINKDFKMYFHLYLFLIMNFGTLLFNLEDDLKRSFRSYKKLSEKLVKANLI